MAFWSTRVKDHTKHDDMTDEKNLKTGTGPDIDFCLSFFFLRCAIARHDRFLPKAHERGSIVLMIFINSMTLK
jgi:hypothetical protein